MSETSRSCLELNSLEKSNWESFGSTGHAVVLRPDEITAIQMSTDPALEALRARLPHLSEVEARDRDIFVLAKGYEKEGELEFDDAAAISEGDDNGAYVSGWLWVSFADTPLDKESMLVRLTLTTADGATGVGLYREDGTHTPMSWNTDADLHTISAVFEVLRGGKVVETLQINGDQWRDMESAGLVEEVVECALDPESAAIGHALLDALREAGIEPALIQWERPS